MIAKLLLPCIIMIKHTNQPKIWLSQS